MTLNYHTTLRVSVLVCNDDELLSGLLVQDDFKVENDRDCRQSMEIKAQSVREDVKLGSDFDRR